MARVPDLVDYCAKHELKMITVADLIAYRRRTEKLVERIVSTKLPTDVRGVQRRRLPLPDRRQAPRRDGQGRGRRRRGRPGPGPLRVPHRRRLPLAALRLRRAARGRAGDDRAARARACCSTSRRRGAASACSTSCAPTSCRRRASTPSTPTSSSGCPPTCATTASAPRSWWTSGCRASASSPTTRRRSSASRATGSRSPTRCRSSRSPTPTTRPTCRAKRDRMGHALHHQGLPLDEQLLYEEHRKDEENRREGAARGLSAR